MLPILCAILVVLCSVIYCFPRRPANFPPGPRAWPLVGCWGLKLDPDNRLQTIKRLFDQYGEVFSIKIRNQWVVFVDGYDLIRDVIVDSSSSPHYTPMCLQQYDDGTVHELHQLCRHVCGLCHLPATVNDLVYRELLVLLDVVDVGMQFRPVGVGMLVNQLVYRVIHHLVFGYTPKIRSPFPDHERFSHYCKYHLDVMSTVQGDVFEEYKKAKEYQEESMATIREKLREAAASPVKSDGGWHYVGHCRAYLNDNYQHGTRQFSAEELESCIHHMISNIVYQSSFTIVTLRWTMLHLVNNPHLMFDAREELDSHLGTGEQLVKIQDRKKLPVCEATLREVQRLASVRPYSGAYEVVENMTLGEYQIPENTKVVLNYSSVNHDSEAWHNPELFNPKRFLTHEKELVTPVMWLPLGPDSRKCPYEQLNNDLMFLIFTTLLRHLDFNPITGQRHLETDSKLIDGVQNPEIRRINVKRRNVKDIVIQKMYVSTS